MPATGKATISLTRLLPASIPLAVGRLCALSAALLSAAVLASWLARAWIGHPEWSLWAMKANTSLATLCVSLAMLLLLGPESARRDRARRALATVGAAVSLATLAEYASGVDLGIDQLLASDTVPSFPGRISPWSAATLACLAAGALAHRSRLDAVADAAVVAAAALLQLVVAGHLYGATVLYGIDPFIRVSVHSLLAMTALWVALATARAGYGAFEIVTRSTVGGTAARWLLPIALVVPPLLGALRLVAQREGWIASTELGVALFAVAQTLTLTTVAYALARHLDVVERRYLAERRRRGELARLVAICAWTGRVQWKGEWVRVELFLKERFGVAVTHTISEEAIAEIERELAQPAPPSGAR